MQKNSNNTLIGSLIKSCFIILVLSSSPVFANDSQQGWKTLFSGNNLAGWEPYISMQPLTNDSTVKPSSIRGVNNDPLKVFTVTDGILRVSGEEWGGLSTRQEYENFHLKFEVKWGKKKWAPRENVARDSGVLYFAVGPQGAQSGHWMRSHEFQVQEGDSGDYHSLDGVTVDAPVTDANEGDWKFYRYDPKAIVRTHLHSRILKRGNFEKPSGEWDNMEIIADGKTMIHKVNGKEVLRMNHSRQTLEGKSVPLTRGKIQIQSEGAEVFYRNVKIKILSKPAEQH